MSAPLRLAAFGVGLAAVFGVAAAVGAAAGPIDVGGDEHDAEHGAESTSVPHGDHGVSSTAPTGAAESGLRVVSAVATAPAGEPIHYTFTIAAADGPIVEFDEAHERRLHLILVSDDLVDFWHVHPEMDPDGTWHIELPPLEARVYTVYADVKPTGGQQATLRTRLAVTADDGGASPRALPEPAATSVVDGFDVRLAARPAVGSSTFSFEVTRAGETVATEPYLGALGHLVAIRTSDQDYLHVHPLGGDGPAVEFAAALPSAGTYRLFLDFSVDGVVRTASFTVEVPAGGAAAPAADHGEHDG